MLRSCGEHGESIPGARYFVPTHGHVIKEFIFVICGRST